MSGNCQRRPQVRKWDSGGSEKRSSVKLVAVFEVIFHKSGFRSKVAEIEAENRSGFCSRCLHPLPSISISRYQTSSVTSVYNGGPSSKVGTPPVTSTRTKSGWVRILGARWSL